MTLGLFITADWRADPRLERGSAVIKRPRVNLIIRERGSSIASKMDKPQRGRVTCIIFIGKYINISFQNALDVGVGDTSAGKQRPG